MTQGTADMIDDALAAARVESQFKRDVEIALRAFDAGQLTPDEYAKAVGDAQGLKELSLGIILNGYRR